MVATSVPLLDISAPRIHVRLPRAKAMKSANGSIAYGGDLAIGSVDSD